MVMVPSSALVVVYLRLELGLVLSLGLEFAFAMHLMVEGQEVTSVQALLVEVLEHY
jgi:hypothetical protein